MTSKPQVDMTIVDPQTVGLPPTRADWVEQQLRRAILFGEFLPGQRLFASELTKRFSVSPTPLREALQRLATDGLVDMTPQRGVRVTLISQQDAIEIYELRCILEPLALRKSLLRKDERWQTEVQQTYAHVTELFQTGHVDAIAAEESNRAFHQALLSRCESKWLLNMIGMLTDHCVRSRLLSFHLRGGSKKVVDEHQGIYEACLRNEVEEAALLLERHLHVTLESIAQYLQPEVEQKEEKASNAS